MSAMIYFRIYDWMKFLVGTAEVLVDGDKFSAIANSGYRTDARFLSILLLFFEMLENWVIARCIGIVYGERLLYNQVLSLSQ